MANWTKHQSSALTELAAKECAAYILEWLQQRNGNELREAFEEMRVGDARLLREELEHILKSGGKPDNWI